jgi:PAT family beta-lactamase induction signal transducer AmpG
MTSRSDEAAAPEGRPVSIPTRVRRWLGDFAVYGEPRVARMVLLGFSAGLPLLLVLGTLSYRLRESGIDRVLLEVPDLGRDEILATLDRNAALIKA